MIEITSHRQGEILNHNHGVESDKSLKIHVEGISETGRPVKINNIPAEMAGRRFSAEIELTEKFNPITASVLTPYGVFSQQLELVWDKKSYKRFFCYLDDHSFLFTDLAKQRPKRAFDHFYLTNLKKCHDQFGLKVTLNAFYHNDHHDFELKDMPDIWKSEFEDNSDWLRFSFHSYGEFPDRPYLEATAEEFGRDYDLVYNEIVRFAGKRSFIPPQVIHWANIHPAVAQEYIRRGSKCYSGAMRARVMGGPSLADRQKGGNMKQVQTRSVSGEDTRSNTDGLQMHYDYPEERSYLNRYFVYYDPSLKLFFFGNTGCCTNLTPLDVIPQRIAERVANNQKYGVEISGFGGHEQYSFPYYPNYLPDHDARIELLCRLYYENGYKGMFANEGVLGNNAWDEN